MLELQAKTAKYHRLIRTTILLGWLFCALLTVTRPTYARNCISVNWETTPLFTEEDLKPGDVVPKWVEVTNLTDSDQDIGISATLINSGLLSTPDSNGLDFLNQLLLVITNKDTGEALFGSNDNSYLSDLFTDPGNEIYLSTLPSGQTITYELYVEFPFDKGNEWQSRNATFDLSLGCITGKVEGVKDETPTPTETPSPTPTPIKDDTPTPTPTPTPTAAVTAEWVGPEEEGGDILGVLEVLPKTGQAIATLLIFAALVTPITIIRKKIRR